ncbi:hypothetical protein BDV10DRAFT_182651 [Aspergillus recurvatus]
MGRFVLHSCPDLIESPFSPFAFTSQRDTEDLGLPWSAPFPLALKATGEETIHQAVCAIRTFAESGQLRDLIKLHGGAILIRGLPIQTPQDYSSVAHALGAQRENRERGSPELPIWPHNEYGWPTINPAWLTFSALKVPSFGGATPITSSIHIAHRLERAAPGFVDELKRKGAKYTYRYTPNTLASNTGNSISRAYGAHVTDHDEEELFRRKVEREVRRHSACFEWHEDGSLSVTHVVPADTTGLHALPSSAAMMAPTIRHRSSGTGTPMDVRNLDLLLDIAEEGAALLEWEEGGMVILDNYAEQHSRRPWKGDRQVLAALWDDDDREEYRRIQDFPEGLEILRGALRAPVV